MAVRQLSGKKPQNMRYTLYTLLSYMGRHKFLLLVVAVLVTISALANLLGTYMIRPVVNSLAAGSLQDLVAGVAVTAAIYGLGALSALGYTQTMVKAAQKVLYDGIDVKDIRKDALRRSLGIVLQDTHLFTGTIADNIRFGKLDATQEEIERAARIANADSFIRRLPQGYDTMVTADGANLSQGQRQLLAIARAAVADPPVLILDEATSSIDTRTEALIEKGMDQLMEGRTVFVIAHRLSTVRNANAILVLEHGQVVERGSHEELLAQKGEYYQLYHGLFELS